MKRNTGSINHQINNEKQELQLAAIRAVAATPEGRIFINFLMGECGFTLSSIVMNEQTNEINTSAMLCNEALRRLYLNIRRLIPAVQLQVIEHINLNEELALKIQKRENI
jgi:hypothetical protein